MLNRSAIVGFVDGVAATAIGTIAGSFIVLDRWAITDAPALLVALSTVVIPSLRKKPPGPIIVVVGAMIGLFILRFATQPS